MVVDNHHCVSAFAGEDVSSLPSPFLTIPIHNNNNLQYFGDVGIGSGAKNFRVIYDTGSERLWVPSAACTSSVCKMHHRFDSDQSSTFRPGSGDDVQLAYGTGHVRVQMHHDDVRLPSKGVEPAHEPIPKGLTSFENQENTKTLISSYPVGLATSVATRPFSSLKQIDGLFGIGQNTKFAKAEKLFSFYLSNDTGKEGALMVGGIDKGRLDPNEEKNFHWFPTKGDTWSLDLVGLKVGDSLLTNLCSPEAPCSALVDSGSSNITGPPEDVSKILSQIHATCGGKDGGNSPPISLVLRDAQGIQHEYPLSSKEYSIDFRDTNECNVALSALNMGQKKWVLGNTFLRRYLSVFDQPNHRIGFAKSHHDNEDVGVITRGCPILPIVMGRAQKIGLKFLFN